MQPRSDDEPEDSAEVRARGAGWGSRVQEAQCFRSPTLFFKDIYQAAWKSEVGGGIVAIFVLALSTHSVPG